MIYYYRRKYMKVISIDIGATSGRVMTVTEKDGIISYEENARFENRLVEKDDTLYWDFPLLLNNIQNGLKKALAEHPDVKSASIDTWAVDYGVLDQNGNLKGLPLCYRDRHSFGKQKEFLDKIPFEKIYSKVGIQNLHFNTIYQLYKDERIRLGDKVVLIPDLIAYFLTGSIRMEETNASTTSLYDSRKKKMDEELLASLSLPASVFPEIIYPGESYGYLRKEAYPDGYKGKPVEVLACCSHDTASAVLGTDGFGQFAYLSSGTWSLLGTELKEPLLDEASRNANFTNEIGYGSSVRYLKNTMGMFLINEVRKEFANKGKPIPVSKIKEYVDESEDIDSYLDVDDPCFETPGEMIEKVDRYLERTGQMKPTDEKQYLRLVYQSMALSYRLLIETLEKLVSHRMDSLIIVGGGNQAVVLNQFTANAINRKVVTGPVEATVIGNSLVQFIRHGVFKDVKEAREAVYRSTSSLSYLPLDVDIWNKKYEKFRKVIKR